MTFIRVGQIVGAYVAMTLVTLVIAFGAKAGDKVVYVVFPPWLAREDVHRRITASGGRVLIYSSRLASTVAVSDRTTLDRLYASGAALVLTTTPARLCTSGGVAAR